jgi:2-polyprenyl-3-methyl-5-hydroxy-6-metoxy-1,4-benzoquinol methylase
MLKNIPFAYHWIVRRAIGNNVKTVLDLGCGDGEFMKGISEVEGWNITGVELFESSIKKAKKKSLYSEIIRGDVSKLPKNVVSKKYDVVFASQVLEHLKKSEGKKAIKIWQCLAKKRLVITTPVGFIEFSPIEDRAKMQSLTNPLQKHLSGWTPKELESLGFVVRGQGLKLVYGPGGIARKFPSLMNFFSILFFVFSPLAYFFPKQATYMISYRDK